MILRIGIVPLLFGICTTLAGCQNQSYHGANPYTHDAFIPKGYAVVISNSQDPIIWRQKGTDMFFETHKLSEAIVPAGDYYLESIKHTEIYGYSSGGKKFHSFPLQTTFSAPGTGLDLRTGKPIYASFTVSNADVIYIGDVKVTVDYGNPFPTIVDNFDGVKHNIENEFPELAPKVKKHLAIDHTKE